MNRDEFFNLKSGDKISWGGVSRTVERLLPHDEMVEFTAGDNLKASDPWLPEVVITYKAEQVSMVRFEMVISGIDAKSKAWFHLGEAIESVIEEHGGEVVEYNY